MDQNEKDWLDLGRQLKDYHPAGDPKEDFQTLQELQRQQPERKRRGLGFWTSENLLLLALLPFLGLLAFGVGKGQWDRFQRKAAAEEMKFAETKTADQAISTEVPSAVKEPIAAIENTAGTSNRAFNAGSISLPTKVEDVPRKRSTIVPRMDLITSTIDGEMEVVEDNPPAAFVGDAPPAAMLPNQAPEDIEVGLQLLPTAQLFPVSRPMTPLFVAPTVISKQPSNLQITLGTGLSNHWRGANFMQEVDRGIYAYVGIYRRIGRRFGLEGRIGYRAHGMRLPVVSDVDGPWSYHKEEIHTTGQQGEDRAYIYEGVVEGYQAVEFSLLADYQVSSRLSVNGGVRYSLPDLAFERTVVGPDEENPFFEFIERQPLVKYQDYGALLGVEYHFSRLLTLEAGLHLGMVDLIDDAAAGRIRFNHSSSVSLGVKYKLGE